MLLIDLQSLDKELLIFLNNLGNTRWDGFWLTVTDQFFWWWLYAAVLGIFLYKFGWKNGLVVSVLIISVIALNDQFINIIKNLTDRVRPCNEAELKTLLRVLKCTSQKSFFSAHAANAFLLTTYSYVVLKNKITPLFFAVLFVWSFAFAYSRIYIGVHYPSDVLTGMFEGIITGYFAGKWFVNKFTERYDTKKNGLTVFELPEKD
jgi:undecaprenyl-diphosphatase